MKYKKILLKLSGESLMGKNDYGISPSQLKVYVEDIKSLYQKKIQIGIVIGGGNIFRGIQGAAEGFDRVQGDYMGMLATVINSMALQSEMEKQGLPSVLLSGIEINPICEKMSRSKAKNFLEAGKIVIIAAGTGNPYFTTDTAAALRAVEIEADVLLKGTRVDGVYDSDPEKNPNAHKFKKISFQEAYEKELKIMDLTAFSLCMENSIPILVFDMNTKGNLLRIIDGEEIGSIIE
ncbi:MAG TPA: UMP kinase [Bacteroidetes bacterium]|nr:UMP kinase [Bacteroidota bacterium]